MGKPTGFLEWERLLPKKRPPSERVLDAREFQAPYGEDEARRQAGRCMDCGVPFCHQGCPLGNVVPDFQDAVFRGRWDLAFEILSSTNDFPEVTGRICPAPCEAACVLALDGAAVSIEAIEKEIADRAWEAGRRRPERRAPATGKRVAVVGSGPAGMAAARRLALLGHDVELIERDDRPGGLLRYGIPDFKLDRSIVDGLFALLSDEGVSVRTGVSIGASGQPTWRELLDRNDAVVVATGARVPRELDVPGRALPGVTQAMPYLEAAQRTAAGAPLPAALDARGRRVVVLGGGDTGSDCLGTALRQGAASVTQLELLPAPPSARAPGNPWPAWPIVFRTSTSQEEGGERRFALRTLRLEGDGRLERLVAEPVRREGERLVAAGEPITLELDRLILALGFTGPETAPLEAVGVRLDARGNVAADGHRTSVPKLFVAGDAMRGASLVVWAIADGRACAKAVDAALRA